MATVNQQAADDTIYVPPPGADDLPGARRRAPANEAFLASLLDERLQDRTAVPAAPTRASRQRTAKAPQAPQTVVITATAEGADAASPAPVFAPAPRKPTHQVRVTGQPWWQQFVAEALGFLVFGVGMFASDMLCTVVGITELGIPATAPGYLFACLIHIGISLGQRYYLLQRGPVRLIGVVLLSANSLANVYGILPVIDRLVGEGALGQLPRDPARWPDALLWSNLGRLWKSFWDDTLSAWTWHWPVWSVSAIIFVTACVALAWFAEYLLVSFWRRVKIVWMRHLS